ncbi:hypothetical protein BMS3Abin16_01317 [archaeon BMS3Abin16]|nr:hypothetical protein BMS3Abin16_01317 [archaeon BMS3Abin16]GBE56871.1 hypothetical protein BMS3Bbin16_01084 [archaeon BMS3Bbin16]
MIPELTEKLLKLGEKILTQDFINVCERKALAFNENTHANLDNSHLQVVIIVINGECILDGYHRSPERVFWNENGEEFLNVRENRGIKDQIEEISTFSSGIKERAMGIKELLEQLKDRYRKEYNTC